MTFEQRETLVRLRQEYPERSVHPVDLPGGGCRMGIGLFQSDGRFVAEKEFMVDVAGVCWAVDESGVSWSIDG